MNMNKIQIGVFSVCAISLVLVSQAGDIPPEVVMQQNQTNYSFSPADLKRVPEMQPVLRKSLATVEGAKCEMAEFQAKVAKGAIPIENNNGLWSAAIDESKTVMKMACFATTNGPIFLFTKWVFANEKHEIYLNDQGYELNIYTNGVLQRYTREGQWFETIEYYPSGKIMSFNCVTSNGQYTTTWDEKTGKLLEELLSKNTLNAQKPETSKDAK